MPNARSRPLVLTLLAFVLGLAAPPSPAADAPLRILVIGAPRTTATSTRAAPPRCGRRRATR